MNLLRKNRTCPNCNYSYSLKDFLVVVFKVFIWQNWKCKNCNQALSFDVLHRIFTAIFQVLLLFGVLLIRSSIKMNLVWFFLLLFVLFVGYWLVAFLNKFKKKESSHEIGNQYLSRNSRN